MSDYISRAAAIRAITEQQGVVDKSVAKRVLTQLPSADVVEVIRCKDCDNWQTGWKAWSDNGHYCGMIDGDTQPDFYCSYAERRNDG